MSLVNHFGIRVTSAAEVDRWHERVVSEQERYGISRVTTPRDLHGDYQFYFLDRDGNWWELHHPIREA
jgi:catechol 2,3-dioxygenase-like lactoylglutathione lyase family enzyme